MYDRRTLAITMGLALLAGETLAKTWRVERDGSGDFTTIQPAIDAAAEGDTILIGPGRYDEMRPDHFGDPAVGSVHKDGLSLIGTSCNDVVVGPAVSASDSPNSKGFSQAVAGFRIHYQDITVENVGSGLSVLGTVTIRRCHIRACQIGVNAAADLTIDDCDFESNDYGIWVSGGGEYGLAGSTVRDCVFRDNAARGILTQSHDLLAERCDFNSNSVGFKHSQGGTGVIVACEFVGTGIAVWGELTSQLSLRNCIIMSGFQRGIFLKSRAHLSGSRNQIGPASIASLDCWELSTADFHHNDILLGAGPAVRLELYDTTVSVDLSNNYWGTTDLELIDAKILDWDEQPGVVTEVIYQPILDHSVPTKTETVGGLKSRYAPQN